MMFTCSAGLGGGEHRPMGRQGLAEHADPAAQLLSGPDPAARLGCGDPQHLRQRRPQLRLPQLTGQIPLRRRLQQQMVGQRQPVPERLETLQTRHETLVVLASETTLSQHAQVQVEGSRQPGQRLRVPRPTPEFHAPILYEHTFDY
jgi:hypothetical protein